MREGEREEKRRKERQIYRDRGRSKEMRGRGSIYRYIDRERQRETER